ATRQVLRESALLPLIVLARPEPPKRGNPSDAWGTLFLLALTEHIYKKTKKKHRYFKEAYVLLKILRADSKSFSQRRSTLNKQTAITRIRKYKQAHPAWRSYLHLLKRLYTKQLNQMHTT